MKTEIDKMPIIITLSFIIIFLSIAIKEIPNIIAIFFIFLFLSKMCLVIAKEKFEEFD